MSLPIVKKVLFIGWDAAEWRIIRPLVAAGLMPNLGGLIGRGASGSLVAGMPLLSPTLWTTLVTGQRPTRHQILGPYELRADQMQLQPIGRAARLAEPVWSILERAGVACLSINFPATHPAEPLSGISISNQFALSSDAATLQQSVWPHPFLETLAGLRLEAGDIDAASLLTFVPQAAKIDRTRDHRLDSIAQILAHSATVHAAATAALEQVPWDFAAICYTGIHQFSHLFMPFHPPCRSGVNPADFEMYQHVITAAYRFHDLMLGRLLQLSGAGAHVLLVSDHGFHCDHLRPATPATTDEAMLTWHRQQGVGLISGPGIHAASSLGRANVLDVAPTLLQMFGLPVPREMEGRAWFSPWAINAVRQLSARTNKAAAIPLDGCESHNTEVADTSSDGAIDHLLGLGYTDQHDPMAEFTAQHLQQQKSYYLAVAWLDAGRPAAAVALLEGVVLQRPDVPEYDTALALAYGHANRLEDARRVVDRIVRRSATPLALASAAMLELATRRAGAAVNHLQEAQRLGAHSPILCCDIGRAYMRLQRWPEACDAFKQAVQLDAESVEGYVGLGAALLASGNAEDAVVAARQSLQLDPAHAEGHYRLGMALARLGEFAGACAALEFAVHENPDSPPALRKLSDVYERLGQTAKAAEYDRQAHAAMIRRRFFTRPEAFSGSGNGDR